MSESDLNYKLAKVIVKAPYNKLLELYNNLIKGKVACLNTKQTQGMITIIKTQMRIVAMEKISTSIPQSITNHFVTLCKNINLTKKSTDVITKVILEESEADLRKHDGEFIVNPIMLENKWNFSETAYSDSICATIKKNVESNETL